MKKNEPSKNSVKSNEFDKYFNCQKCGVEFVILYFEELPEKIQRKFRQILKKTPARNEAFFFYCKTCDEFSVLSPYFTPK